MTIPAVQPNFNGGELAPALWGHLDLQLYHRGASTCRNVFVNYLGGLYSRAGTAFIGVCPQNGYAAPPRDIPFQFNITQGFALEFGDGYMRIKSNGAYVESSPGVIYAIDSPYAAVDLPYLKYAQSADVMSLTCVNIVTGTEYPPYELRRLAAADWTFTKLTTGSSMTPPATVTAVASNNPDPSSSPPTQPCAYAYVVTAVNLTTGDESNPSPFSQGNVTNTVDMGVTAGSITVTWAPIAGAGAYNIYRTAPCYNTNPTDTAEALPVPAGAGYYFAGSAYGNQFVDTNVVTDASETPPQHADPFAPGQILFVVMTASSDNWTTASLSITSATGSGFSGQGVIVNGSVVAGIVNDPGQNYQPGDTLVVTGDGTSAVGTITVGPESGTYPAVVAYFQQRQFFAQSLNEPDTFWASQDGLFTNFDFGNPPVASDAITASPFSQSVDGIQWLVPMPGGLVIFSGTSCWQLAGVGGSALNPQPITPESEQVQPQAFNGISATLPPIRINYDILFGDAIGSLVYSFNYNIYFNIYNAAEISWQSSHLFNGYKLVQWAWSRSPSRIIWGVRNDGTLLSLTWVKEQSVDGWTRHDTQGIVVSVCVVSEPPVDAVYLIVQRSIGDAWYYFAERMDNRQWQSVEDCWCVDAGLSTLGPSAYPTVNLYPFQSVTDPTDVAFSSSTPAFSPSNVGNILRVGGGIATITNYVSPTSVQGVWTKPYAGVVLDPLSGALSPALAGTWSILPQTNTITGLGYLAGRQVVGLADGIPLAPFIVPGDGNYTLPFTASLITVGLAFTPQIQTLYLAAEQPTEAGRRKSIYSVTARVAGSGFLFAGTNQPDGSAQDPPATAPPWTGLQPLIPSPAGAAPPSYQTASGQTVTPLFTGDLYVNVGSAWQKQGQVALQQFQPLPLNLTAVVPNYLPGDLPEAQFSPRQQQRSPQRRAA